MDNWREGTRTGHTHEPNDATIQLDGLGRQLAELPGEPAPPEGSDGPVFVDESGRRSKTFRRLGWVLATVCAGYAVTLVFAVLGGNSTAPWLPLSGPKEEAKAEQVEELPETDAGTADDGLSDDGTPEPGPSASDAPAAGASGVPAGATPSATSVLVPAGSADRPSASASADPSRPATGGGGGGGATKPAPTTSTAKPPVDPTPPTTEPEPTEPTGPPVVDPEQPVQEESAP
ncbi:hypothetical protein [Streptomyces sp. PTY087I2]|uniref:hypothetical protein n=1 Tax=Streptomyces sp. PTY087I2 TaxID=1819298 RepID=UPI00080B84BC|nr:hypothetical protein [Streptomyces sp. PTY087I2]OCC09633.1 hypothetical protein A3Q37_04678 [Streptomyces sp. PTY087I2]